MCEGAEKIQKGWKLKIGDYIYLKKNEDTSIRENQIYLITDIVGVKISYINTFTGIDSWCYENRLKSYFIYLPTQEQLQEITLKYIDDLEVSYTNKDTPAIEANIWLKKDEKWDGFEPLFADDWNTLWLQIFMLMKYHKIWTGSKWVKAEGGNIVKK